MLQGGGEPPPGQFSQAVAMWGRPPWWVTLFLFQKRWAPPYIIKSPPYYDALGAGYIAFKKIFLFWVPMNDWKAKLESAYSFKLKYSKITVCKGQ